MMSENLSYWDQFRRASRTFYDALDKRPRLHGNGWVVWNNNETVIDRPFLMNVRKKNEPSELHVLWPFTLREYFSFFILFQILLSSYLFSLIQRSGRSFHFFFPSTRIYHEKKGLASHMRLHGNARVHASLFTRMIAALMLSSTGGNFGHSCKHTHTGEESR